MRRWNGWGEESTTYPLPPSAAHYLESLIGKGEPAPDVTLQQAVACVPPSRLPAHSRVTTAAEDRLRHARGQSLPDWIDLRSGRMDTFPDGVAYPNDREQVRELLAFAQQCGAKVIPYGGGTSVVGHINPLPSPAPVLTIDLANMKQLVAFDETSQLATFQAGVPGPALEALLQPLGYTLGHFPQSFELSTLGGWIASRSSGQQSYHYGRIENLFAGGHLETPVGAIDLPTFPASAAGPDLRQMVLGSEGRLGVITDATVRVRRLPEVESFRAIFFHDWDTGIEAVRAITQSGAPVSMLRLSDAQETETTLALSGHDRLVGVADRGLRALGFGAGRCLLIYAVTGSRRSTAEALAVTSHLARTHRGLPTGTPIGRIWRKSRFLTPYLRNTLWEHGFALDTVETAVSWSAVPETAAAMTSVISQGLQWANERVLAFAHLSHIYRYGASVYLTFLFRRSSDPEQTLQRWQSLKAAVSRAIIAHGGTISHQHGVGLDHAPYLPTEIGELGVRLLQSARRTLDPQDLLNPGKLLL